MAKSVAAQLHEAYQAAKDAGNLTLEDLLSKAQRRRREGKPILDCDFTSLSRKLHGKQGMTVAEANVIAEALGIELDWSVETKVKAS